MRTCTYTAGRSKSMRTCTYTCTSWPQWRACRHQCAGTHTHTITHTKSHTHTITHTQHTHTRTHTQHTNTHNHTHTITHTRTHTHNHTHAHTRTHTITQLVLGHTFACSLGQHTHTHTRRWQRAKGSLQPCTSCSLPPLYLHSCTLHTPAPTHLQRSCLAGPHGELQTQTASAHTPARQAHIVSYKRRPQARIHLQGRHTS